MSKQKRNNELEEHIKSSRMEDKVIKITTVLQTIVLLAMCYAAFFGKDDRAKMVLIIGIVIETLIMLLNVFFL